MSSRDEKSKTAFIDLPLFEIVKTRQDKLVGKLMKRVEDRSLIIEKPIPLDPATEKSTIALFDRWLADPKNKGNTYYEKIQKFRDFKKAEPVAFLSVDTKKSPVHRNQERSPSPQKSTESELSFSERYPNPLEDIKPIADIESVILAHEKFKWSQKWPTPSFLKLQKMIGLASVKEEIETTAQMLRAQEIRKRDGLPTPGSSLHLVFTGNPGTGKTVVARLVSQVYKELGVLKKGHLVEVGRSQLVGEYIGHTARATKQALKDAEDGVLFIDEAYSLTQSGSKNDFGAEAISELIQGMENNRGRVAVIVAGYREEMRDFLKSNPGLGSRFKTIINFDDYSSDELFRIFQLNCKQDCYDLDNGGFEKAKAVIQQMHKSRDGHFGNGREIRNLFEDCVRQNALRLGRKGAIDSKSYSTLSAEDILERNV